MQIERIDVTPVVMKKKDRDWRFALGAHPETSGAIVTIHGDDGVRGFGYTSDSMHLGTTRPALIGTLEVLGEKLVGRDALNIEDTMLYLDTLLWGNQRAKAGLEIALHDLKARHLGIPVYDLLGGAVTKSFPVIRILGLKKPAEMAAIAADHVEEGYRHLKVKIEGDVTTDVARIREIRAAVGDDVHLTVDANQTYSPVGAIKAIRQLERHGIDLVEQPVRMDDFAGLAQVRRAVETPIEADESAASVDAVFRLAKMEAVDRISIKVIEIGGFRAAARAAAICEAANLGCRVGAAVGSRLHNAAYAHFAAATRNIDYACELGEFVRLEGDPVSGMEISEGVLTLSDAPGLGLSPT